MILLDTGSLIALLDPVDALLAATAEALRLRRVFTLHRGEFDVYRIKRTAGTTRSR